MTLFLVVVGVFCITLGVSHAYYLANRTSSTIDNLFFKIGRGYDKFFFNHGEPTARLPKPEKETE